MALRNTKKLKELIYGILSGDGTLKTLLGGVGRVREASPQQLSDYPLVVYTFLPEIDNPYKTDQTSNIVATTVLIECFSNNSDSEQVDALEDRVYTLLEGQRLSNSSIQAYSIHRVNKKPIFEADVEVWKTQATYELVNATI